MEIQVLRYFLTVVREESITKAEAPHIAQPRISRQLAQLEEELGVKLFDQGTRKISLTTFTVLAWKREQPVSKASEKFIEHAKCFLSMGEA